MHIDPQTWLLDPEVREREAMQSRLERKLEELKLDKLKAQMQILRDTLHAKSAANRAAE